VAAGYLSRRFGRSQNGMGDCFSSVRPFAAPPSGGSDGLGPVGLGPERCRAVVADQPLDGQAGRPPLAPGAGALAGFAPAAAEPPAAVARARPEEPDEP
jgi:hypothetical protein